MFRRIFNLEEFFQDHRNTCYLLIDVNKYKVIQDVENHIKVMFSINDSIYLSENGVSLPSFEDIRLLTLSSEPIRVKPFNTTEIQGTSRTFNLNRENTFISNDCKLKEKKRKKRENSNNDISTHCNETSVNDDHVIKDKKRIKRERKQKERKGSVNNNDDIDFVLSTTTANGNDSAYNSVIEDKLSISVPNSIKSTVQNYNSNSVHCNNEIDCSIINDVNETCNIALIETNKIKHENVSKLMEKDYDINVDHNNDHTLENIFNHKNNTDGVLPNIKKKRTRLRRRNKKKTFETLDGVVQIDKEMNNWLLENKVKQEKNNANHIRFDESDLEMSLADLPDVISQKTCNGTVSDTLQPQPVNKQNVSKTFSTTSNCIYANGSSQLDVPISAEINNHTSNNNKECKLTDGDLQTINSDCVGSSHNESPIKPGDSSATWFNELLKVKQLSQNDKPPVFSRTPKVDNKKIHKVDCTLSETKTSPEAKLESNKMESNNHTLLVDDIVDFKILFLSQDYSPTVSESVIGRVIKVSDTLIKLKILCGKEICRPLKGKFSLVDMDENDDLAEDVDEDDIIELYLKHLINPRKVINPFDMFNSSSPAAPKS